MKQRGQFYLVINAQLKQRNGKNILQLGTCCWHACSKNLAERKLDEVAEKSPQQQL
jgi:hypothetical protein